jgi:uncharacterized membrane protein
MAREPRRPRLDQPRDRRRVVRLPRPDSETFGRWSEDIARFFGTARYIFIQTVIVAIWIAFNGYMTYQWHNNGGNKPFDPYPFILLNLAFSTQAAYAAPLILLAQNRQADRDRVRIEQDRETGVRTIADAEYLAREIAAIRLSLGEVATRDFLRGELQRMLDELDSNAADGEASAGEPRSTYP